VNSENPGQVVEEVIMINVITARLCENPASLPIGEETSDILRLLIAHVALEE
jgi:hypothetical protein